MRRPDAPFDCAGGAARSSSPKERKAAPLSVCAWSSPLYGRSDFLESFCEPGRAAGAASGSQRYRRRRSGRKKAEAMHEPIGEIAKMTLIESLFHAHAMGSDITTSSGLASFPSSSPIL